MRTILITSTLVVVAALGCGDAAIDELDDPQALGEQEASPDGADGAIQKGSRGPAVSSLYQQLQQRGYFPNAELPNIFPFWSPLFAESPRDPSVFGDELDRAVRAFQEELDSAQRGRD
jgi:peptidoglycan hydrolase-like protein with peptidoglycan-binding domain